MTRFLLKIGLYGILIFVILEVLVRIFHLYDDRPTRFVDSDGINKWIPGQTGYAVYGNRVQNKSAYRINKSGFNSYREFEPSNDKIEIALIGDSFIEGFHQDYTNSIGKKIENKIDGIEVYEYGHASNDFADQLYLISKNQDHFSKIDHIVFYLRYGDDLERNQYKHINRKPLFKTLRKSKLLEYGINIGLMDPIKSAMVSVRGFAGSREKKDSDRKQETTKVDSAQLRQDNFDHLIERYNFDIHKSVILLDSRETPDSFLAHLQTRAITIIDFANAFEQAGGYRKTTLIYDQHWNNFGREIIAGEIYKLIQRKHSLQ
ncbi:hypothetical protein [Flagellimonas sp.]|uniref:hypothetical protein n=1 Tax=Flagellimonas sp. TaxID=2058762 RepID=UPI003B509315